MALLSANCVICERALREADGVFSAIRIVDIFFVPNVPGIPLDQQVVPITLLGMIRVSSEDDTEHTIELSLTRPNGEESVVNVVSNQPIPIGRFSGAPRSISIIARMGVLAKQLGMHQIAIKFDNQEVANTQFTLSETPEGWDPNEGMKQTFPQPPQKPQ